MTEDHSDGFLPDREQCDRLLTMVFGSYPDLWRDPHEMAPDRFLHEFLLSLRYLAWMQRRDPPSLDVDHYVRSYWCEACNGFLFSNGVVSSYRTISAWPFTAAVIVSAPFGNIQADGSTNFMLCGLIPNGVRSKPISQWRVTIAGTECPAPLAPPPGPEPRKATIKFDGPSAVIMRSRPTYQG